MATQKQLNRERFEAAEKERLVKAFIDAAEQQNHLREKIARLKQQREDVTFETDANGIITTPVKVDSLLRLLLKEEITRAQYSLGAHYHFCSNIFIKTRGRSLEVIDGNGGNADKFFQVRADAARFIKQADNLCTGLELRLLQGVCGRNESIRNVSGAKGSKQYLRGQVALILILKKMEEYFGKDFISYSG